MGKEKERGGGVGGGGEEIGMREKEIEKRSKQMLRNKVAMQYIQGMKSHADN